MEILFEPKVGAFEKTLWAAGALAAALAVAFVVLSARARSQEAVDPHAAGAARYRRLAEDWVQKGKALPAVDAYGQALRLSPQPDPALISARGDAWMLLRRFDRAQRDFERAMSLAPSQAYPVMAQAMCLALQGRLQQAVDAASQALRLDPGMALAFFWRGFAEDKQGRLREAEADFSAAIARNGSSTTYLMARGATRLKLRDMPGARADLDRAVRIDPKVAGSRLMRSIRQAYGQALDAVPAG
ncbi:MAG: tetratricopeptide repeat protein [Elusimicrobia bacterium]|nr:tetratricopeptide repeat protein [Elusimicrobiota bacterium]